MKNVKDLREITGKVEIKDVYREREKKKERKSEKVEKKKLSKEEIRKRKFELAQKYANEVVKKFKKIVKSVVLFGSVARGDVSEKSDIDILVIYDDTAARFTPELKQAFDLKLRSIAKKISPEISVQPAWSLTEFWDMARIGHPLLYTIVRDGWALYDVGFFIPVRKLLEAGRIPHTLEAIELLMHSAPKKIRRVKNEKLYLIAEDLYYAMLNASQAVLMMLGKNAPTPKEAITAVKEYLVDTKLLPKSYYKWFEQVVKFRKQVEHKRIKNVSGERLDAFIEKAERYVAKMQEIMRSLQRKRKELIASRNYEVMLKAAITALKAINKLPKEPKEIPRAIKRYLIEEGRVNPMYEEVIRKVALAKKMANEGRIDEITERELHLMREYVRRFVREVANLVKAEKGKNEEKEKK